MIVFNKIPAANRAMLDVSVQNEISKCGEGEYAVSGRFTAFMERMGYGMAPILKSDLVELHQFLTA